MGDLTVDDLILRGPESAQLLVDAALAEPGQDVHIVAQTSEDMEMALERVRALIDPAEVVKIRFNAVHLANQSRILARMSRRDGAGVMGTYPDLVWLIWDGDPPRYVMVELIERLKRRR